ncbi:hypothetical protein LOK49_LG01G01597 [Camellia lanceoleosa]|uniref:Uncharacterized protein n=1 Tax=Camellia lanceoleosa TaxID=1840588 RepID=A0ACC0J5W9_9ERIC|nr:hypothetical protein LOK49_LG01G01597 [Camellia lanceoleosa]
MRKMRQNLEPALQTQLLLEKRSFADCMYAGKFFVMLPRDLYLLKYIDNMEYDKKPLMIVCQIVVTKDKSPCGILFYCCL